MYSMFLPDYALTQADRPAARPLPARAAAATPTPAAVAGATPSDIAAIQPGLASTPALGRQPAIRP